MGPKICEPNDGAAYDCCNGGQACRETGTCCMTDTSGSNVCVEPCTNDNQCGTGHCVSYVGPASGSTCVGNMACGP
jgi:hypothetical protein